MIEYCFHYPVLTLITAITFYSIISSLLSFPKKHFTAKECTNIVITGGVQGLGKDLAKKFATKHEIGSVNLIILDIAEHLAEGMITDIKKAVGGDG